MAIMYTPSKFAFYTEGDSLTEQEHKDSCDINIMIKQAANGQPIRMDDGGTYGYDDTTMTALDHKILKQQLEEELGEVAESHEFSEEELNLIPAQVKKKFGFKTKKKADTANKNDELNDEKIAATPSNVKTEIPKT